MRNEIVIGFFFSFLVSFLGDFCAFVKVRGGNMYKILVHEHEQEKEQVCC